MTAETPDASTRRGASVDQRERTRLALNPER